jgi:hypothetical protein
VQRLRQHPVPDRLDHLDHATDTGGGLGVREVGLEGSQPQRAIRRAVLTVGGQ